MINFNSQFGKGLEDPSNYFGNKSSSVGGNALSNLELFISNMIGLLTVFAGIFFVVYFVLGALSWITAGGDSGKIQKARDQMVQGVIGMIVIIASYAIIGLIGSVVGLRLLSPAQSLRNLVPGSNAGPSSMSDCLSAGNNFEYCDSQNF